MAVSRLRLKDILDSELFGSASIGYCAGDVGTAAKIVNRAQQRLLTCREAGDTGWYGGYAEIALTATQNNPYITLPRGVARLIKLDACNVPMRLQNQFYEYLDFGSGRWPRLNCPNNITCKTGIGQGLRRNTVPTFVDLTTPGYGLRMYLGNAADVGKRVFVSGTDQNGNTLYQLSDGVSARGVFATLASPFVDLTIPSTSVQQELGSITGIQKDLTVGSVRFYQVNLTTGDQTLILTMEPGETVAAYQRYYLSGLPDGCCPDPTVSSGDGIVTITAMAKLDLIPVRIDTDWLLIQSTEAIIAECQAARFGDMDSANAKSQAAERHREAVRYLQGQLVHMEGKETPAVNSALFGYARLANQRIGQLI